MQLPKKKIIYYFLVILLFFLLDRFSKIYILNLAEVSENVDIYINSFLNIILVWNKGVGFGLFSFEEQTMYNFITLLIILINIIIIYIIFIIHDFRVYFYLIILGGSLGNLFDRVFYSGVPDFIDLNYKGYHWFIFNLADIFISFGIICLILSELIDYNAKKK